MLPQEKGTERLWFPQHTEAGPEMIISDGLFSVIILTYVSVTFLYVFYAFCFRADTEYKLPGDEDSSCSVSGGSDAEAWRRNSKNFAIYCGDNGFLSFALKL